MENNFEKLKIAMRYFLIGGANASFDATTRKKYSQAAAILEWAESVHCGKRKGGEPEFIHQIQMAHLIRTYWMTLSEPIETLVACLVHDTAEDYPERLGELRAFSELGEGAIQDSLRLSKIRNGSKTVMDIYFSELAKCPRCSVVKGVDRINNLQSMLGVFKNEKQAEYIAEAREWISPMLKSARRSFPDQEGVYENIKLIMGSQMSLLEARLRDVQVDHELINHRKP